jgi:hypothetical protein
MSKILLLISILSVLVACERNDEFANAPSVEAPNKVSGPATAPATGGTPTPAADLPQGHPPLPQAGAALPGAPVRFASVEEFGKVGALTWTAPAGWEARLPSSSMRLAEYVIPGEAGPGELTIFYFGPGGGGGVDANIARWIGQFATPEGQPVQGNRTTREGAVKIYLVEAQGTFNPGMAGSGPPRDQYKLLGAIAESSVGLYFFKLVGPQVTISANSDAFETFIQSLAHGSL